MDVKLLDQYAEMRGKKKSLDEESKEIASDMAWLEDTIVNMMIEEGTDQIKRNGFSFHLTSRIRTKSLIETAEAAERLIDAGLPFLATLNHMRVKSYIAEQQEGSGELNIPAELHGVVEATRATVLGCRKAS